AQPCQGWGRGFESHRPLQKFQPFKSRATFCSKVLVSAVLPCRQDFGVKPCKDPGLSRRALFDYENGSTRIRQQSGMTWRSAKRN
ncbi:MAG TPA: hypothetical protein PKE65_06585, partial [Rhizobiaceae bacterium]|nr:hypothetical protein [Rhizobiaceae bacterium]